MADETYAATSWICSSLSMPANADVPPPPFLTCVTTVSYGGGV